MITTSEHTPMGKIFHPLLTLIASATDSEIGKVNVPIRVKVVVFKAAKK